MNRITILVDTREQENSHILEYFDSRSIPHKNIKQDVGDYSVMLLASPEHGLFRDIYFPITIERKNSVDELVQSIKERTRFENELIRSKSKSFLLMVEDLNVMKK